MKRKIKIFSFAAILMLAVSVISCKHNVTNNTPETCSVTFGVDGTGGTLTAKADGIAETEKSPITVEEGKTVTFTAKANDGYRIKAWTLDGKPVNGADNSYQLKIEKAVTVKVSFEKLPPGKASYTVKHYQEKIEGGYPAEPAESENQNGTVGANAAYTAKNYTGFTYKSALTKVNNTVQTEGTINADSSTVVELYYERNTVNVTFKLAGGNVSGSTADIIKTGKYGTPFTAPAEPAKATGIFKGWKPALPSPLLFPASNAEHTAEWTPKALLTLEAGKNTVKVKAKTADGKPITVEGCNVNELANDTETTLTVTNPERKLALIGDIIELNCSGEETPGGNRPLIALDVSGCTALQKLNCQYNKITALDVQGLTALQELYCRTNQIPELNVQGLTKLQKLNCTGNQLTTLNVQGLTALQELDCDNNNQLATLDVQGCTALQELNCRYNKIAELNVSDCTALKELDCQTNQLKTLNVQGLTELQQLKCGGNQLTALDVSGSTALQKLYCQNNQLPALDVQDLATLQKLDCSENQLKTLNVQGCTALKELICYQNKLNADVFTKLFNDLPIREASDGAEARLYVEDEGVTEGNCKNFSTPESLKKAFDNAKDVKHWKMQKTDKFGFPEDI